MSSAPPPLLALAEPFSVGSPPTRPDLGRAMLLGACGAKGIPVRLVQGPTRWIRDLLCRDQDEIWHLLRELDEETGNGLDIHVVRILALDLEMTGFFREVLTNRGGVLFRRPWSLPVTRRMGPHRPRVAGGTP